MKTDLESLFDWDRTRSQIEITSESLSYNGTVDTSLEAGSHQFS